MKPIHHLLLSGASALTLCFFAGTAQAQQAIINFDVCQGPLATDECGPVNGTSYIGPGFDSALPGGSSSVAGGVSEASATNGVVNDGYDGWGALYGTTDTGDAYGSPYASAFNGLSAARQTQTYVAIPELPANSIRWFDSFTNSTGATIDANIAFGGNLGSDSNTYVHSTGPGYVITGQYAPGTESPDPVIAHLYGNNDYAFTQTILNFANGDDNPFIVFPISVAPGQTVSVMNVDLLFGDNARNSDPTGVAYAADVALAISQAELFVNNPIFAGLTVAQLQTLVNWDAIVIDGSIVGAGAIPGLSQGLHGAFDGLLDNSIGASGGSPSALLAPLQYAGEESAKKDSAETFAYALGKSGGDYTLASSDESRAYLFGGYTTGVYDYTAGDFGFSGYVIGAGIERAFTPNFIGGVAAGYTNGSGDIAGVFDSVGNHQFTVAPYARFKAESGLLLDARMSVSTESWDYQRVAGTGVASAEFDGTSFGAKLGISKAYESGEYAFTPFANASYLHTNVSGFTETGAGAANLIVPSYSVDKAEIIGGVSVSRKWMSASGKSMNAFVSAGLGNGFLGNKTIATSYTTSTTTFATDIESTDGIFGRIQAGFSADITKSMTLSGSYSGTVGSNSVQHTFGGKLLARF